MFIRNAVLEDAHKLADVERRCFPEAEAATIDELEDRLKFYANHFWLMFDGDRLIAFVDGMVTNERDLADEMYENAALHDESGD